MFGKLLPPAFYPKDLFVLSKMLDYGD